MNDSGITKRNFSKTYDYLITRIEIYQVKAWTKCFICMKLVKNFSITKIKRNLNLFPQMFYLIGLKLIFYLVILN